MGTPAQARKEHDVKVTKAEKFESQMRRRQNDVKWGTRDSVQTKRKAERDRAYLRKIGALA